MCYVGFAWCQRSQILHWGARGQRTRGLFHFLSLLAGFYPFLLLRFAFFMRPSSLSRFGQAVAFLSLRFLPLLRRCRLLKNIFPTAFDIPWDILSHFAMIWFKFFLEIIEVIGEPIGNRFETDLEPILWGKQLEKSDLAMVLMVRDNADGRLRWLKVVNERLNGRYNTSWKCAWWGAASKSLIIRCVASVASLRQIHLRQQRQCHLF